MKKVGELLRVCPVFLWRPTKETWVDNDVICYDRFTSHEYDGRIYLLVTVLNNVKMCHVKQVESDYNTMMRSEIAVLTPDGEVWYVCRVNVDRRYAQ
jgi:uncharacterized radical SAM superfamily Fe-S cluster-containing enzyme